MTDLTITRIETRDVIHDPPTGTDDTDESPLADRTGGRDKLAVRIETDGGPTGEYLSRAVSPAHARGDITVVADRLLGASPFDRERLWHLARFDLRKYDAVGMGLLDIALWDLAGKQYQAPIHELLGTYRHRFPAYASPTHGDAAALESPAAYARFAEACRDEGFHGYKIHTWSYDEGTYDLERDIATVEAVGEAVGDDMALMLDLSGKYETMSDVLEIADACSRYDYRWIEDPFGGSGRSQHGHRRLRELIDVPVLQLEHVRGVEPHVDFVLADGTDFVRVNPELDGGITGAMKISHAAEALGVDVEVHSSGPAKRHCLAAIRNAKYYEMNQFYPGIDDPHPQVYGPGYSDGFFATDSEGMIAVPDGPGLGVELDWPTIEDRTRTVQSYEA